jgi:probable selenium-dependent hydroxylase accessory protein YqeC
MAPMPSRPLVEAFDIPRDARVAAIGGGGKMTLLLALGMEWARAGGRPLLATAARIEQHAERGVPGVRTVLLPVARSAWTDVRFLGGELLVVGRKSDRPGALDPLTHDEIDALAKSAGADLVLVKADDARGRSLVDHAPGEGAVPLDSSLVIAVAGLDAWGTPLGEDTVHRHEQFAEHLAMGAGERLEDDAYYAALADASGYRALVPPGARYAVFLNKADRPVRVAVAQRIALGLIERGVGEVVWGDVRREEWTVVRRGVRAS